MNGSTVGDIDTSGHVSGQCQSCGLYTAYGAQFMIGSCQINSVITVTISRTGWPGWRRHITMNPTTRATIMRMVPIWWTISQWWKPNSGSTGLGAPVTDGFLIRSATAPG